MEHKPKALKLLGALALQNALLALTVRQANYVASANKQAYLSTVAVAMTELLKFVLCLILLIRSDGIQTTLEKFLERPTSLRVRIIIPALIYGRPPLSVTSSKY